jgi:recombinational DNA repair ATPase RecF
MRARSCGGDQARVTRLADHLGRFPTVVFSSQDIQLVRGSPANRRRWLDLTLAAMDGTYLRELQTFTRALAERNALLKSGRAAAAELSAFEQTLAPAAAELIRMRRAGLADLEKMLKSGYAASAMTWSRRGSFINPTSRRHRLTHCSPGWSRGAHVTSNFAQRSSVRIATIFTFPCDRRRRRISRRRDNSARSSLPTAGPSDVVSRKERRATGVARR